MDFSFLNIENYEKKTKETEYIYNNLVNLRKNTVKDIKNNNSIYNHIKFKNIISNTLCDFIINESEKYALKNKNETNKDGWTRTRHKNYPTTDLPIKDIDSLSILINNMIRYDIFPLIEKYYNVNKYFLDCNDIFIVRYKDNEQTKLERHKDGCAFSFNILLNDENEFEGGGTIINENMQDILVKNEKGGLILHSGQVFHSGNIITKGIRYILVGFIGYLKGYDNLLLEKKIINYNKEVESDCNLNSWKIDLDDNYYDNISNYIDNNIIEKGTFLLDTTKNKFNLIEQIIYDLSVFHLKRLNLELDFDKYKIEFWWKNENIKKNISIIHGLHSDKDEILMKSNNILKSPLLSTVTYINDSIYPTLLTSTPEDIFKKNNQINLRKGVILSFPKKLKHISFNGSNLHGVFNIYENFNENGNENGNENENENENLNISNRKTLMFNIWNSYSPLEIKDKFFNNNEKILFEKNKEILNLSKLSKEKNLIIEEFEMKELLHLILYRPLIVNKSLNINKPLNINKKFKKFLNLFETNDIIYFDIL
jgi:hypothetical protein